MLRRIYQSIALYTCIDTHTNTRPKCSTSIYIIILVISMRIHLYLVDANIEKRRVEKGKRREEESKTNYETNQMRMLSIANAYV